MPPRQAQRRAPPSAWRRIGRIFATGLLTLLPIIVTIYFTVWLLTVLERFFGKQVLFLIPDEWYRTGMGLVVAIGVVFLVGLLMHAILFRRLFGWAERLLLLAYPLHPAGEPERLRAAHLPKIQVPVLCINGTRDALCRRELMDRAIEGLGWHMHWLEGKDHSFAVTAEVGALAGEWLSRTTRAK